MAFELNYGLGEWKFFGRGGVILFGFWFRGERVVQTA